MKWMEPAAWALALGALAYGACGGSPDDRNPDDVMAPASSEGDVAPGTMPSDGTRRSNSPPLGGDISSGNSSGSGGTPPPPGTIPPAESPNAPPSGIAH
jgi:hypothetical protein